MIVIFIGPPGCGKGTQADFLVQERGFRHVSTGELLRCEISTNSDLSLKIQDCLDQGNLVPDHIVFSVLKKHLDFSGSHRLLLDGFPRNEAQALLLDEILKEFDLKVDFVFNFQIDEALLKQRIVGRFACAKCGAIYHDDYCLPKKEGECDFCGSKEFKRRDDDSIEVLSNRLVEFNRLTKPLYQYYVDRKKLHDIDAAVSVEQIKKNIFSFLEIME